MPASTETVEDLLARAYRPGVDMRSLETATGLSAAELHGCLHELTRCGGIAAESSIGFLYAAVVSTFRRMNMAK